MTALDRLGALCRRFGGEIVLMPTAAFGQTSRFQRHPFGHHAIDWYARRVLVDKKRANPGVIVHEMGHLFCEDEPPHSDQREWDWLGWEIVVARLTRCYRTWSAQNATYIIDDGETEWSSPDLDRRALARERVRSATTNGYLDRRGRPRCVRSDTP